MSDPKTWSGPGVIISFFKLYDSTKISQETIENWYDREYAPASLENGTTDTLWLYKAANANYDKPHLVIQKVSDLAFVQVEKLQDVAKTSKLYSSDGSATKFSEFEIRIYSFVQLCETSKQTENAAPTIMLALMEPRPGKEANLDAWYREEHNQQMSNEPGWQRTTRFNLIYQQSNESKEVERLSFLAIHEFGEGNQLGTDVKVLEPVSAWTKEILSEAKAIDAAIYHKRR